MWWELITAEERYYVSLTYRERNEFRGMWHPSRKWKDENALERQERVKTRDLLLNSFYLREIVKKTTIRNLRKRCDLIVDNKQKE